MSACHTGRSFEFEKTSTIYQNNPWARFKIGWIMPIKCLFFNLWTMPYLLLGWHFVLFNPYTRVYVNSSQTEGLLFLYYLDENRKLNKLVFRMRAFWQTSSIFISIISADLLGLYLSPTWHTKILLTGNHQLLHESRMSVNLWINSLWHSDVS